MRQFTEEEARQILALAAERDHAGHARAEECLTLEEIEEAARSAGLAPIHVQTAAADLLALGQESAPLADLGETAEHDGAASAAGAVLGLSVSIVGGLALFAMWLGAIPSSGLWVPDPFLLTLAVASGAVAHLNLRESGGEPARRGDGGFDRTDEATTLNGRRRMLRA